MDKTEKQKRWEMKKKQKILGSSLNQAKIAQAIAKNKEKKEIKEWKGRLKIYSYKFIKYAYAFLVDLGLYNLIVYGIVIMMALTLFGFDIGIFEFFVGVSLFIVYDLITGDWRK